MSEAIVAAIEDHRRAVRIVRARRLWKRRLARALWAVDDDIDAITEGPEEWHQACADLEAAEEARARALLRLSNIRPRDLDSAATWIVYPTSLGKEGPSLAQIAAVCAIKAKIKRPQVIAALAASVAVLLALTLGFSARAQGIRTPGLKLAPL
jgi:hypothetical protein